MTPWFVTASAIYALLFGLGGLYESFQSEGGPALIFSLIQLTVPALIATRNRRATRAAGAILLGATTATLALAVGLFAEAKTVPSLVPEFALAVFLGIVLPAWLGLKVFMYARLHRSPILH